MRSSAQEERRKRERELKELRKCNNFKTPAIDGERKPSRNHRQMDMGGVSYTPSEEPIRPDVDELLEKEKYQFENWYLPRLEAVEDELDRYELICSIPNLSYGGTQNQYDMTSSTHLKEHIDRLRNAKGYLVALKEKWEEMHDDIIVDW